MAVNLKLSDLDALFPFYICIDQNNKIIEFGRSTVKCFLNINKGMDAKDIFSISSSKKYLENQNPHELLDKIVIMESKTSKILFKGEVIYLSRDEIYIFTISPIIQDSDVLINFKLSYADFPKYSPFFDFFILTQSERFARKEQSLTLASLKEQNSYAKLNLNIANFCSRCSDISESLEYCRKSLEQILDWQMEYKRCAPEEADNPVYDEINISLLITSENIPQYKINIGSKKKFQINETLKVFINTLKVTLENLINRVNQHSYLQEVQAQNATNSKMYSLGEMAAGIAHELNNPLTVIQGIANVSLKNIKNIDINPSKIEEDMNKIIKMTKRSAKIIHGLRVFARDAAVDPMEKIDLNQVVEDTLELCKSRITYRNIRLDWSPIEECFCMGRAVQISQVLLNLLSNSSDAVENTIDPWIKIVINQKENFWNVSVIDSGPGIPEKIYQKMMSPFFTTKAPGKGTGLGLSISNSILNEHGGEFYYVKESPFTEFKFTLPIYKN